ncbi:hypothetical protein Lgee_0787 [Legionella geestiana]|uniref:Uncharacterized protein n=1 Tax=Legionella geestiana TaxID=45065 RepID=A0A0W0U2Z3_9GAMM|nr:hypothetical protein Lgee_0787 [Legionella geestiana]
MVRKERLELSRVSPLEPKSSASAIPPLSRTGGNYPGVPASCKAFMMAKMPGYCTEGKDGVNDGTRTHDNRDHNPGLYQLSYAHHNTMWPGRPARNTGTPGRIRTCYPRLRRPMLYPDELRTQKTGRGGGIRTPDILLPKQARYQAALHPAYPNVGQRGDNTLLSIQGQVKNAFCVARQVGYTHTWIGSRIQTMKQSLTRRNTRYRVPLYNQPSRSLRVYGIPVATPEILPCLSVECMYNAHMPVRDQTDFRLCAWPRRSTPDIHIAPRPGKHISLEDLYVP